jgi:hypothetical protein
MLSYRRAPSKKVAVNETVSVLPREDGGMEQYVRWYVTMEPYYKILFLGAALVGSAGLLFGMATENPVFFTLGLAWLVGGPATIWVVSRFESDE